jgi:hypothetical protein
VGGLVLCAMPYRFQEKLRERAFHLAFGALADAFGPYAFQRAEQFHERLPELPEHTWAPGRLDRWALTEFRSTSGWALAQVIAEVGRFDATLWLSTLKMPTAVVITTRDRSIPVYRQLEMATMIPGASIHLVKAGHASCVLEADRFVPIQVIVIGQHGDREPGAVEDRTERIQAVHPDAEEIQRHRRPRHVGDHQVVHHRMPFGQLQRRVDAGGELKGVGGAYCDQSCRKSAPMSLYSSPWRRD